MEQTRRLCRALLAVRALLPDPDGSARALSSSDLPRFRRWPMKGQDFP